MSLVKAAFPFLGVLGAVAFVVGGVAVLARGAGEPPAPLSQDQVEHRAPGNPAIDAVAPAGIETATFALG